MDKISESILWYDLETFGINAQTDRIAQFAGIRTDFELNIIEEPIVLYCKITPDFLPDPLSCLVTGITPQITLKKGINENDFVTQINNEFSRPGTVVAGYNNIKFDDEFIRNALYRNLMDPYIREYANGNSRWDIINLVRMTHDLRPDGIIWPVDEDGKKTFRLEKLTEVNGLSHENAHDALSDVYATIDLAKLIKTKQPKLYDFEFGIRRKRDISPFMDIHTRKPFLFTTPYLTNENGMTSIVSPIAIDVQMRNKVYCIDLTNDPTDLLELSIEELRRRVFTKREVLKEEGLEPISIISIYMNRVPAIAPLSVLKEEDSKRLGLDVKKALSNYELIKESTNLSVKLIQLFNQPRDSVENEIDDPDLMIYSGNFLLDADKDRLSGLKMREPEKMLEADYRFDDPRLPEMVWRFVCRNYPKALDENQLKRWKSFCASRLLVPPPPRKSDYNFYMRKINEKLNSKEYSSSDKIILSELLNYGKKIGEKVLDLEMNSQP